MARYLATVESVTALVATAPSGANGNQLFGNLVAGSGSGFKLRRLTIGVRAGVGAPTSQQLTLGIVRTTARGTQSATNAPKALDPNAQQSANSPGIDTAWTAVPTATWTAPYLYEVSFNSQSGVDLPFELLEELIVAAGTANGLGFINVGNALPTGHLLTASCELEE
jgi:hypothetical protein